MMRLAIKIYIYIQIVKYVNFATIPQNFATYAGMKGLTFVM